MRAQTIDARRLRRALSLHVEVLDDGAALVTGGSRPHVVRARVCDCEDSRYHAGPCKHRAAAYLHAQLHPAVRAALREALSSETTGQ